MFQLTPPHKGRRRNAKRMGGGSPGFNSRPRIRGDRNNPATIRHQHSFNSRPRIRGDAEILQIMDLDLFQLTPPHKGRRRVDLPIRSPPLFQLTPPHKGRRATSKIGILPIPFQLTPPHKGRRSDYDQPWRSDRVSTHAPA